MRAWRADWNKFVREVLKARLDREQQVIIESVQHHARTAVSSGTARGKDFVSACASLCFMYLTPRFKAGKLIANTKVAMTAPTGRQVANIMTPEVRRLLRQAEEELTTALKVGLSDGLGAHELSREVKKHLEAPDKLFRRVRDEEGRLHLSKPAKDYHPGMGVYRSSHKNALRLTRTEINMAYRRGEQSRWRDMDFVVGYEIRRSGTGYDCPVCEALAGKYPKDFVWSTWHPHCRCYAIPILKTEDELFEDSDKPSINEVKEPHEGFQRWVEEQKPRIVQYQERGTLPLFLKENPRALRLAQGEEWLDKPPKLSPLDIAKARHAARTPEQIEDIKKRWDKRSGKGLYSVANIMKKDKIDYLEVAYLKEKLSEEDIIARIGGGDLTKGSCSSLALAYAGNKGGLDVLDFRGGNSQTQFSYRTTINAIAEKVGGFVVNKFSDYDAASELFQKMSDGKEYYFACAAHASIVRKSANGLEYLELQSATDNGFKPLNKEVLKLRFGAKRSRTMYRKKVAISSCIIDIELLNQSTGFRTMLGYINTNKGGQKKGVKGTIK